MASRVARLRKLGSDAASVATRTAQTVQGGAAGLARSAGKRAAKTAAKAVLAATGVGTVALGALGLFVKLVEYAKKQPLIVLGGTAAICVMCMMCMSIYFILAEHVVNPLNWPDSLIQTVGCSAFTQDDLAECTFEYSCEVVANRVGGDASACQRFLPPDDEETDSPLRREATEF